MAKEVVKNLSLFVGGLKLPSNVNALEVGMSADEVEVTNGASAGWREVLQGIRNTDLSGDVWLENTVDPETALASYFANATAVPWSGTKSYPPVQGDVAFFQKVVALQWSRIAKVGEAWHGTVKPTGASPGVRGRVLENVVRSGNGNSAVYNLGVAVGATERLWVATHLVAATALTSLVLKAQSDDAVGFPSSTDRLTIPTFTAVGGDVSFVDGPITDTYWRINATLVGTSVEYLVLFGIAPKTF